MRLEEESRIQVEKTREAERFRQQEERLDREHAARITSSLDGDSRARIAAIKNEVDAKVEQHKNSLNQKLDQVRAELAAKLAKSKETADAFCFVGDTPILVSIDQQKAFHSQPISTIRSGDSVVSCRFSGDFRVCEMSHVRSVISREVHELVVLSIGNSVLKTTPNHPFYLASKKSWVPAHLAQIGDQFLTSSGEIAVLTAKTTEHGTFTVYNLEVAETQNYYACNILVHNCTMLATASIEGAEIAMGGLASGMVPIAIPVPTLNEVNELIEQFPLKSPRAKTSDSAGEKSKRFTEEQQALVDMAKKDKRTGITEEDMEAYKDLNKELGKKGFTDENAVRGPEEHPGRPFGKNPHGHVGPVDHIPIKK